MLISGDAECLRDDIRKLAANMEESGVAVSLHEYKDMIHDFCTWTVRRYDRSNAADDAQWMKERVPALRDVGSWLAAL